MHRYKFFSALHKDRVILILKNGNYYSYGNNAKILNYIGFKGNTKKLIDKETGLYLESPEYVYDLFKDEMNFGHIIQAEI